MDRLLKWQIDEAFKRVPRLGTSWRYVPLHRLPQGAVVRVETKEPTIPQEERADLYLDTNFTLKIGIQPCLFIQNSVILEDDTMLKPLSELLAATSVFRANVEYKGETLLVQSGEISKISVIGTGYNLHEGDDPNPERKARWQRM